MNKKSTDFDEIWYTTAHLELDDSYVSKYEFLKKWWQTAAIFTSSSAVTKRPRDASCLSVVI